MRWQEIIKVRTSEGIDSHMITEFLSLFETMLDSSELIQATVTRHASIESDLCVLLEWNSESVKTAGSSLALLLSEQLKKYGVVDHSVWVEKGSARQTVHKTDPISIQKS